MNLTFPSAGYVNLQIEEIVITQLVKATFLFDFLEKEESSQYLIKGFYNRFNLNGWREYFQYLIPIIRIYQQHPKEGQTQITIEQNEAFQKNCSFLDALSLININSQVDADFKFIRANPLFKTSVGEYSIIYPLFLVEKLFKGLFFILKEIQDSLPKEVQTIDNFRSFYTTNFSENFLLYKILDYIYEKRNYIRLDGLTLAKSGFDGAPDYYIRNGNTIFIFENKDVLINSEIKQSFNFETLEQEFRKKFYYEDKGGKKRKKAVLQLISNVKKLLLKQNQFDNRYKEKNILTYPILLLHDASFNCTGFNSFINLWFDAELQNLKAEGIDISKIRPVTVINIDTLIIYADYFKNKVKTLDDIIDAYIKKCQFNYNKQYKNSNHLEEAVGDTLLPFSFFIDSYTKNGFKEYRNGLYKDVTNIIFNIT